MPPARPVGPGFSPLDEELALLPGSLCPQALAALVRLGAEFEFASAARLLADLFSVQISEPTARRQTEAGGAVLVAAQTAAAPALAPPADPGPDTPARLQVSVDGAMICLVGGTWVEVKTLAIGVVEAAPTAPGARPPHATALSYFSRYAPAAEFRRLALVETARRQLRCAAAVAGVMDGAEWLQGWLDYHRPDAVRILDLPHALDHLHQLAQAVWTDEAVAGAWWEQQKIRLGEHGAAPVLAAVAPLQEQAHDAAQFAEHAGYLAARAAQMAYPAFRAAGWPVGSGIVESGNKLVVEARLKGPGMRWAPEHVNPLLALRNGVCSGRWAETWAAVAVGRQTATGAARAARRAARRAGAQEAGRGSGAEAVNGAVVAQVAALLAPATAEAVNGAVVARVAALLAPTAQEGGGRGGAAPPEPGGPGPEARRPGPNHPWRRSPIGKACTPALHPLSHAKL